MSVRKRKWKTSRGVECEAWDVDYIDQQGERRLKTFDTKKEADAWCVNALHEVQQGTHTPACASKTVEEAWNLWLDECEANKLEYGTVLQRRQHLNLHVKPFMGREKLFALSVPRVHQFDAAFRTGGRSLAMRHKVLTNLKPILDFP